MVRFSIQPRLVVAGVVAAAGIFLAFWRLWPYLESSEPRVAPSKPSPVQADLGPELLDRSTRDGGMTTVSLAAERARSAARKAGINARRLDDLVAAFSEQLAATIDGDYERDHAARVARGLPEEGDDRAFREKMADWMRGRAIGLERLEVRVLIRDGEATAASGLEEGYDVLTAANHDYPLPDDLADARVDVVEVRLPMDVPSVNGKGRGAALVGYRFWWDDATDQWIPFVNAIYGDPEAAYGGIVP